MRFCNLISCRGKSYFDLLRILQETIVSARCVSRCESWLRLVAPLYSLWYRLLDPVRALSGIQCTDPIEGWRLQRSEFPTCASRISFCPKLCAALPLSSNSVDAKHRSTCVPCLPLKMWGSAAQSLELCPFQAIQICGGSCFILCCTKGEYSSRQGLPGFGVMRTSSIREGWSDQQNHFC